MKILCGVLLVLTLGLSAARAQTNAVPTSGSEVRSTRPKLDRAFMEMPIAQAASTVQRRKARFGGFLADLARSRHPLQMVDPFRPENAGPELNNVFHNLRTGRAQGIALISIRF
ncbi:MAG: hypothetical protein KGS61_04840 [Verrucomicrobia bacterium]|nr:hypothetical protein [Verrucomicrobiota bacterium]